MKNIRKYLVGFGVAGFVMAIATPSQAAFTSKPPVATLTATATTGGTPTIAIISAVIKNISDNATATTIGWTNTAPGWQVATQYIDLNTNINTQSGGVQYYTDNTNAAATPKYTGVISSVTATPAGLVDAADTTQKLPTAWRASTFTITGPVATDPNAKAGESFLWFFHEDKAQVANANLNAAAFNNGDAFVTLYAAPGTVLGGQTSASPGGVHFAQDPNSFGGFAQNAHTFIYTEADFTGALAVTTYSTNRLILEAFSI
jgi:hypothetical protein